MNRILIIVPRYIPYKEKSYYEFPLGLAYISASLKKAGNSVDVLNLNHTDGNQLILIKNKFAEKKYKYILTGGLSAHIHQLKSIGANVRDADPDACIIIGGGVVTSSPELAFDFLRPDFMVTGEGELTIVELIDELNRGGKNLEKTKGIGYLTESNRLLFTTPREPIMDLDSLPWPDLDGFEFEKYLDMQKPNDNLYLYAADNPRFYPIISSRGCPFNCTFCFHPLGQKYRSRSVDDFIKEVEYVTKKYRVNNLAIFDELLSADRTRLFEICNRLKMLPYNLHWMCQLRVNMVDEEMLAVMKESGCFLISYGFESANNKVLQSMNKHINRTQIEKAMELTRKAGIGIQGYFIFGDPAETRESAYETLDFWKKHRDFHITMGYIRPYPGSELWINETQKDYLNSFSAQMNFLDKCTYMPPNLSQMSGEEWYELQRDVQKEIILNDHFGEFLSSEKTGENDYTITIRCPHCKHVVTYKNFHQRILGIFKISCRNCNQAMNMTPLVFKHVQDDYGRNIRVFETIKQGKVPVTVTPCMSEAEFSAMAEVYLGGVNIVSFMDVSEEKASKSYYGKPVLKRNSENIASFCKDNYFLIPLTRFANRIFSNLLSLGVDESRICRLDEIMYEYSKLSVDDFAAIFGVATDEIPTVGKNIIENSDFRYRILSGIERENVFLRVFQTLLSDSLKSSGPHRKSDWEKGWQENLDNFLSADKNLQELIPKFVKKREVIRFRDNFVIPLDSDFETNFVRILRYHLFVKYFTQAADIFEFGCGTGLNLVAAAELFPQKSLFGLDWATSSVSIVNELSTKLNLDLTGIHFDMFSPDYDVAIENTSAVFTIGAMEQLGTNFMPFVDFLLNKKPEIIINIEVNYELHGENSLFDYVASAYLEKRNYLRGYYPYLKGLEKQGKIDILETRKTFGGLYHNGYVYTVWKPKQ